MTLGASCIDLLPHDMVLLAPGISEVRGCFQDVETDPFRHQRMLHLAQAFRGSVYLSDGAIKRSDLKPDGRHVQPIDYESWHVLALDARGSVCGCVRYRRHEDASYDDLGVRNSALATSPEWGWMLQLAVEQDIAKAKMEEVPYAEVGGWAIAPERRCTLEALRMALSTYAIAQVLGGSRGITTATVRHRSSSILRRIGGRPLVFDGIGMPPYYDPRYGCEMEILGFDSHTPSAAYRTWVDRLRERMPYVRVLSGRRSLAEAELLRHGGVSIRAQYAAELSAVLPLREQWVSG